MRLFLLTTLIMIAFADNSVLTRAALIGSEIDPLQFAWIRAGSGALALAAMVVLRDRKLSLMGPHRLAGAGSLALYMIAFSVAYVDLDAGAGALILFGMVQVTMFASAILAGEPIPVKRWLGAGLAFAGLVWLLWPEGAGQGSPLHGAIMVAAGIGWGIYSLVGRKSGEPLRATAANFILVAPICFAALVLMPVAPDAVPATTKGVWLAIGSGVVTSAMGYALWYTVLPLLAATAAAVAQLTVPVIALAGGILFLGEALTLQFVIASALVLGGVALSLRP